MGEKILVTYIERTGVILRYLGVERGTWEVLVSRHQADALCFVLL